jgi:hypothetical protein
MIVRLTVVAALVWAGATLAQPPTCQALVDSIEQAFDEASSVVTTLTILQGDRELAYNRSRSYRDDDGELQTELLERRGAERPGGGGDGEGQGELDLSCEGHTLTEEPADRLTLELPATEEGPLQGITLAFVRTRERFLPVRIDARFQVRILFIPINGTATTLFSEWTFPPTSN